MVDVSGYTASSGQYLRAADVKKVQNPVFVITSEGIIQKNEKFGNMRLVVEGEFMLEPKIMDIGKTNARIISDALGSDTKKWIGAILHLETYKTKTSDGKLVDAINVSKVEFKVDAKADTKTA
jgi:hypothetical protein